MTKEMVRLEDARILAKRSTAVYLKCLDSDFLLTVNYWVPASQVNLRDDGVWVTKWLADRRKLSYWQ